MSLADATEETRTVQEWVRAGRFRPKTPSELSHAIGSAVARRQSAAVKDVASRLPALEMRSWARTSIEHYQTRVTTKMTVAMERLAVIAAITLPVTEIASVYGMNVIVNEQTHWVQLVIVLAVMVTISLTLLRWARRQGWW